MKPKQPEPDPSGAAPIYTALKRLGIARIEVTYDGSGDGGCIDGVTAFNAKDKPIDKLPDEQVTIKRNQSEWDEAKQEYVSSFGPEDVTIEEAIKDWCYEVLENEFPGWEIDDGAYGSIVIDVAKRKGRFEHYQRFVEATSHEGSF